MRSFWKKAVAVVLIALLLLPGCSGPVQPVEATPSPGPTDEPTPAPTATPAPTPTPTATPTPTPMATPTPSPKPTPTLVPMDRRNEGGDVQERLFPLLSCSPEPTATAMPLSTPNPLLEGVGKIGAMVFANCPILGWPHKLARVLGRESYHLFYIRNVYNKQYYYVTTQEGLTGYIKASQCVVLEDADIRQYFDAIEELQRTVDYYSPDAFLRELQTGTDEGSMAERIYRALGRLGLDFDTLVITGPNTGGKTVSLKTIGLLAAMNQCGLHIPAADGSALPVYSHILADIGDEQSIEQSLSTFSAHMTNIVSILAECDEHSLLLFDELGAGTDPTEGAALAIAIIEYARQKGAVIAATTHYAELKVYATNEPGVQNASCEFDVETLRPTYRLLVGIPGKSNAFAISRRLGLGEDIIDEAKKRVNTESASFEATIEKLEQTRVLLEKDRDETAKKLREAEESAKKASFLRAELEVRLEKADQKARREAERVLAEARATAEETFAELDEMRRRANEEEDAQRVNEARSELRRRLNLAEESLRPAAPAPQEEKKSSRPIRVGDRVEIKAMGVKADVTAISADRTLSLRAGIMNVTAREDEVLLLEGEQAPDKKTISTKSSQQLRMISIEPQVDLRGMEVSEALLVAERYLDSAVMAKLSQVTIIHGKGIGALRNAVQQMLRRNKAVKSFRLGRYGEGETGVTVVELK